MPADAPLAEAMYSYEPANGHGLKHDPFNAIVGPRPIGWISSVGADGVVNLAPYSFFNAFNYHPPIIGFSSIGWKDSVANIKETGEFVWNLATRALADKMNATSATVPRGIDEFGLGQLTHLPSTKIAPPRVGESPVHFECKLTQLIQLEGIGGVAVNTWMVFGEVVAVHIDPSLIVEGVYQTANAHPILRAGRWGDYAEVSPDIMFVMPRPNPPSF
jgi:flavin reductase (DIM6/NTAB) family NADH-FMN oxidoreductase RutF